MGAALPVDVSGLHAHLHPGENLFLLLCVLETRELYFLDKAFLNSLKGIFFKKQKGARLSACLLAPDQRF